MIPKSTIIQKRHRKMSFNLSESLNTFSAENMQVY